jgi:hypothetical protein
MASGPHILQNAFDLGIRRNFSKDRIGANAAWDLRDYVVNRKGAPLVRRGGWKKKGVWGDDEKDPSTISYIASGIYAPFNGGRFILAVDDEGAVWRITPGGAEWNVDAVTRDVGSLKQNPIFYFDDVIFPSPDGSQTMSRANEVSVTEYTYTATYKPTYLTQWKNRMVGAVDETIVFGPPGDPNQAWDDAAVYVQSQPIKGLKAVRTATLVFYDGYTDIIRGLIPAGYDNIQGDLRFDLLFPEVGLIDAFSICEWNDMVGWADRNGVYLTDGAAPTDLTDLAGIRDLWRSVFVDNEAQVNAGNIRVAASVFSDLMHVTITNTNTMEHLDTFVFDIPRRIAWRNTNYPFACYIRSPVDPHQLYAGVYSAGGRVAELSHTIDTDNARDEDTDSPSTQTIVEPVVEFPYHRFAAGLLRIVDVYLGYALEADFSGGGGGDPSVVVAEWDGLVFTGSIDDEPLRILLFETLDTGGTLFVNSVSFIDPGWDVSVFWDAVFGTPTAQQIKDLIDGDVDASALMTVSFDGITGSDPISSMSDYIDFIPAGGSTCLHVEFTVQPDPDDPTYDDYGDGDEFLCASDIHGVEDQGYHYRKVPVRLEGAGIGVRVTQVGASDATRIYSLSASVIPRPGWEQG